MASYSIPFSPPFDERRDARARRFSILWRLVIGYWKFIIRPFADSPIRHSSLVIRYSKRGGHPHHPRGLMPSRAVMPAHGAFRFLWSLVIGYWRFIIRPFADSLIRHSLFKMWGTPPPPPRLDAVSRRDAGARRFSILWRLVIGYWRFIIRPFADSPIRSFAPTLNLKLKTDY